MAPKRRVEARYFILVVDLKEWALKVSIEAVEAIEGDSAVDASLLSVMLLLDDSSFSSMEEFPFYLSSPSPSYALRNVSCLNAFSSSCHPGRLFASNKTNQSYLSLLPEPSRSSTPGLESAHNPSSH